ncbi:MAG: DNA polymerase Y family protein, partial [Verrucomicrobiota bacterium]
EREVEMLARRLWRFSPRVERSTAEPGIFWLDLKGLLPLYTSFRNWAGRVQQAMSEMGFRVVIAVGFSRFGTYAAARSGKGILLFKEPGHEERHVREIPIERLGLHSTFLNHLANLGIHTLGAFIDLPARGIHRRWGDEALQLYQFAHGTAWNPLQPQEIIEPAERSLEFEVAETSSERLMIPLEPMLRSMLKELSTRHEVLGGLRYRLRLDNREEVRGRLKPAEPTLNFRQIFSLLQLRFQSLLFTTGVIGLELKAYGVSAETRQLDLFGETGGRDFGRIDQALAHIRAEFGNQAVVQARLQEGHLPEAGYAWEPLPHVSSPRVYEVWEGPLVRRIHARPRKLSFRDRNEPDGWLIAGMRDGPVEEVIGPHMISSGWWNRETARAYFFVRTRSGRWLWIFRDRNRRWYLQGEVE